MAGGVTQEIQNLGNASRQTGVNLASLGKEVKGVSAGLSQLMYLTGRTASGLSKLFQAPMGVSTKFIGMFDDATKSVANFENAVYLGGQRLSTFSNQFKDAAQASQVYRRAIDQAKEGTRLTTLESEKLFKTLSQGFQGIQTQRVVNDFVSIQRQAAQLGGTLSEIEDIINRVGPATSRYSQLREALAGGDFRRAGKIADILAQRGSIDYGQFEAITRMANRGVRGEDPNLRRAARNRFEAERSLGQAGFDTAQAIGYSNPAQGTLALGGAAARAQSGLMNTPGVGETAAWFGLLGNLGGLFSAAGAGGGAASALGGGAGGGVVAGSGRGLTPERPVYVAVVSGGGAGIAGGLLDAAQTGALLRGGGAAGKIGMLGSIGARGMRTGVGLGSATQLTGRMGILTAGSTTAGVATLGALAAAVTGLAAVTESLVSKKDVQGKIGGVGVGSNFLSRAAEGMGLQDLMMKFMDTGDAQTDLQEGAEKLSETYSSDAVGAVDSVLTKLKDWEQRNAFILESTEGLVDTYKQLQSLVSGTVGYAGDMSQFAASEAQYLSQQIPIEQEKADILRRQYDEAIAGGRADEALAAQEQLNKQEAKIYAMNKQRSDAELKSRTAVLDAANELQKQEITLSKVIRDRNIEARLGIGVSYQDQLDIVKDIAGQIPILEQRMQQQLAQAAKERESGNMQAALEFEKEAKNTRIEIEQTKVEFFKESKAIREGYLDAFKENIFGAGGFAKILPKVGAGNQFMADIAPLGGIGTSGVNAPGKYTTSGLQVSGGYGQTVDYLNRGVNAQFYGALQGAQAQGGIDPLASEMLGESAIPMKETADSTKRTEDRMSDLLGILKGATNGNAVNVNLVGGGVPNAGSGLFNMGATGAGITYGASPNIPAGANTSAPFLTPGAALNFGGSRYGITSPQRQGGGQAQARPGYLSLMQQTDTKGFVGGMIDQWAGLKTDSDRARMSAGLTAREGTLAGEYDQAKAELDALWSEYQREGFNNGMPKASEGDRYLKYQELTRRGRDAQARLRNASMERGGLSRARMGIERFEETGDRDSAVSFATQGSNTILSSAEQRRLEEATRNYEKEAREAGVYGMGADAMNKVREQDRFAKDSIAMNNLNEAYSARRELDRVRQEIGLTVYVATEEGEAGQVQYTIGSTSNPATRNAFNNA